MAIRTVKRSAISWLAVGLLGACGWTPATYPDITPFVPVDIEAPSIADGGSSGSSGDTSGQDVADAATSTDTADAATPADATKPACATDADCAALTLNGCLVGHCDGATKQCKLASVADGQACTVFGACGGTGSCKAGACAFVNPCAPKACTAKELACGQSWTLDPTVLTDHVSKYGCDGGTWAGADQVFSVTTTTAQAALVSLKGGGTWRIMDLAPTKGGTCDPSTCALSGTSLQLGLQPGAVRLFAVDSAPGATPTQLTVTCATQETCGNGTCAGSETCWNCPKDCKACTTCGDAVCNAKMLENCTSCAKDCGACKPGCADKEEPGCKDHPCESCVCGFDAYCCKTAWDSTCAKECAACSQNVCGDGKCDDGELAGGCIQDCPQPAACGDGTCADGEKCADCPEDCGNCKAGAAVCGDSLCAGGEHCGSCAADCGDCGNVACVCALDAYCCSSAFDAKCQAACGSCAKGLCPKPTCGDGVCGGGETCGSCAGDCGSCGGTCGDDQCSAGEAAACPSDCGGGCKGNCGGKAKLASGKECYCDDFCASSGDCCTDKSVFCK